MTHRIGWLAVGVVTSAALLSACEGPTRPEARPEEGTENAPTLSPQGSPTPTQVPTDQPTEVPPSAEPVPALPSLPPPPGMIHKPGGTRSARGLDAREGCDPADLSRGIMTLSWRRAETEGRQQRLALTTRLDGFRTGRYWVTKALSGKRSSYTLGDVQPGGVYYWRVLTRRGSGWVPSRTASFTGPICAGAP